MKYLLTSISLIIALNSTQIVGQSKVLETRNDKINSITFSEFDSLLQRLSILLETHDLVKISDSDHIMIIKTINTLNTPRYEGMRERKIQTRFLHLISNKDYLRGIASIYSWVPSRGMGYYFKKLDVELMGSPHSSNLFLITDLK
jgi:hypothetical protein